jgi:hypothetical protein
VKVKRFPESGILIWFTITSSNRTVNLLAYVETCRFQSVLLLGETMSCLAQEVPSTEQKYLVDGEEAKAGDVLIEDAEDTTAPPRVRFFRLRVSDTARLYVMTKTPRRQ